MITDTMRDFGVFDGNISSMAIKAKPTPGLQAGNHKYGRITSTVEGFMRWVHDEMQGSRHVRHDNGLCPESDLIPDFKTWLGPELCEQLHIT